MITVEMWPALKAGQSIYNVQYDRAKKRFNVVDFPVSTLLKTLKETPDEDEKYKYLIRTRGKDEVRGFEFYLPDEDFFVTEEDAQNAAIMYNLRAKMDDIYRIVSPLKSE